MRGLDQDMKHHRSVYMSRKGSGVTNSFAYNVYGFVLALQVWSYEIIQNLVPKFATRKDVDGPFRPRILLYQSKMKNTFQEMQSSFNSAVFSKMAESSEETSLYSGEDFEHINNSYGDLFEGVTDGGKRERLMKIKAAIKRRSLRNMSPPSTTSTPPSSPAREPAPASHVQIKDAEKKIENEIVEDPPIENVEAVVENENVGKKKDENDEDELEIVNTPLPLPKKVILVTRRNRRPKNDPDFTDPNLKQPKLKDPITVNPLLKYDDQLLHQLQTWLKDPNTDNNKIELHTILGDKALFRRMLKRFTWLTDDEIDAGCFILRRRAWVYPKTYKKNFFIGDCWLHTRFTAEYAAFKKSRIEFDIENFFEYFLGDESNYMNSWKVCDDIYIPLNIKDVHWILCVVRLQQWRVDVYDCDPGCYANLDEFVLPMCQMIPVIFDKALPLEDKQRFPLLNPDSVLPYTRRPESEVPKATKSGDCGVFVLMYIEYLTAGLNLSEVTSNEMKAWREKWAVRLFHGLVDP
ncbi:uncharacterized protein LOC124917700 [Impatiens glandulifera]|uniref:uncharacterized protein LOC124917700 n=1 Tax=Impatiens glandulifera TaxID=253017 RepID=UPI001FB1518B|nr:uncharacterized protein LOC124917700 [Impatiens glandulifera]